MKNKMWYRNTLQYKIKMWFYHLTFRDVEKCSKFIFMILSEIIMTIIGFLILFVLPAFFH